MCFLEESYKYMQKISNFDIFKSALYMKSGNVSKWYGWQIFKAGHETREFESCPKNSSLGYQNGLLDTRK